MSMQHQDAAAAAPAAGAGVPEIVVGFAPDGSPTLSPPVLTVLPEDVVLWRTEPGEGRRFRVVFAGDDPFDATPAAVLQAHCGSGLRHGPARDGRGGRRFDSLPQQLLALRVAASAGSFDYRVEAPERPKVAAAEGVLAVHAAAAVPLVHEPRRPV
ncbi:hypothetical protein [Coralloluteibacterium stylophorae]|uniref:Uncharacterized protein n=1 Tax=Coralloluteibacterium stylophorae TaxID=1776034 RepID=A0A8J7VSX4_9GAMM|nr:hypothetical protein [Coralloluteibacterium stylophorae]MBS7456951.1 hypothetical protein [Coralloluteibacterium stylophorae]